MNQPPAPAQPFLDAVALVNAQMRRDEDSIRRLLDETGLEDLAVVLGQMLQTAVRTQGMTVEEFLEMQTEATLDAIRTDVATGEIEDPWSA